MPEVDIDGVDAGAGVDAGTEHLTVHQRYPQFNGKR